MSEDEEIEALKADLARAREERDAWAGQVQTARDDREEALAKALHWRTQHEEVRAEMRLMESALDEAEAYVAAAQDGDADPSKLGAALAALREVQARGE